ncbi:MAG TPA: Asp-tRNA(Asn)/Glu-tRNA(Gln) amidotransferase subunit GatC [Gemmatimonadaceae bacterium]|nr:Asp-tRNA(Asn)/Glu-tRNA(Gln) amidotransferase subunit GatC [Gemmatimonadaceae bacterium]
MAVSRDDVRHVAALARLDVAESRLPELVAQLNGILSHMDALAKVKTIGVMPTAGVGDAAMPLRADIGPPIPLLHPLESFAPQMRDGFLLVPRLATHESAADESDE